MTALQFYNDYGMYIHIGQNSPLYKNIPSWPYINPSASPHNIPITDSVIKSKFMPCGFSYPGALSAVIYQPNKITYQVIPANHAAISYDFSGCLMAKFCFKNVWYICHIYCIGENDSGDCRKPWKDFLHLHKNDITGLAMIKPNSSGRIFERFKALEELRRAHRGSSEPTLAGLIAADNSCYSVLLNRETGRILNNDDENIDRCAKILVSHGGQDAQDLNGKLL